MYKILGQDGKEYGPVNLDTLRRWVAEGRVNAQTPVQAEGRTDWKPLGDFPELQEVLAGAGGPPGLPPQPAAGASRPVAEGQEKTLAIVSLVLGILSLLTCLVTGIPAIITGAIARSRSSREPARYGGGGLALAGLILGCCGSLLVFPALLASLLLPALQQGRDRAQRIACVNHLKMLGLAARMFANDNAEVFPRDFLSMSNELPSPRFLTCPADRARQRATNWAGFSAANVTYEFLAPGAKADEVVNRPLFRCPIHNNVCYGDGSVRQEGPSPGPPPGPPFGRRPPRR